MISKMTVHDLYGWPVIEQGYERYQPEIASRKYTALTANHTIRMTEHAFGVIANGAAYSAMPGLERGDAFAWAMIGGAHRIASRIDDRYELGAGAFSSYAEGPMASGADLGVDPTRCYDDFSQIGKREGRLQGRIEAVAIVTPNHPHFQPLKSSPGVTSA